MNREDYEQAFGVVKSMVMDWDPYQLLKNGAPEDEWDSEVASIVAQIPRIGSSNDAVHVVSRIFSSSLGSESFSRADCKDAGERLFQALVQSKIILRV